MLKNKNQSGFAHIIIIVAIIVVALVGLVFWRIVASRSHKNTTTNGSGTTSQKQVRQDSSKSNTTQPTSNTSSSPSTTNTGSSSGSGSTTTSTSSSPTSSNTSTGGTNPTTQTSPQTYTVTYTSSGFTPSTITIKAGDTIIFKNNSNKDVWPASDPHPTHTDYPGFDPGQAIPPGGQWSFKFTKVGTWGYHNHLQPGQTGTVVVQ